MYALFRGMLNMIDFTQYDVKNSGILYAMHMFFVFLVALMLVNFLIAVMSTSASEVASKKKILFLMTRLSVALTIERRLHWIARRCVNWVSRAGA